MATKSAQQKRVCFVTVGATASFDDLIEAVLSQVFLDALAAVDYTQLLIQHGRDTRRAVERFHEERERGQIDTRGITVRAFAFSETGLSQQMRAAKGVDGVADGDGDGGGVAGAGAGAGAGALCAAATGAAAAAEGVVISHAGTS